MQRGYLVTLAQKEARAGGANEPSVLPPHARCRDSWHEAMGRRSGRAPPYSGGCFQICVRDLSRNGNIVRTRAPPHRNAPIQAPAPPGRGQKKLTSGQVMGDRPLGRTRGFSIWQRGVRATVTVSSSSSSTRTIRAVATIRRGPFTRANLVPFPSLFPLSSPHLLPSWSSTITVSQDHTSPTSIVPDLFTHTPVQPSGLS